MHGACVPSRRRDLSATGQRCYGFVSEFPPNFSSVDDSRDFRRNVLHLGADLTELRRHLFLHPALGSKDTFVSKLSSDTFGVAFSTDTDLHRNVAQFFGNLTRSSDTTLGTSTG